MSQELSEYLDQRVAGNERNYKISRGIARQYGLADFWKYISQNYQDATLTTTTASDGDYYASSVCWNFSGDRQEANEIQFYFRKNSSNPKVYKRTRVNSSQELVSSFPSVDARVVSGSVHKFNLLSTGMSELAASDEGLQVALQKDKDEFWNFLREAVSHPHRTRDFSEDRLIRQFDNNDLVLRQRLEGVLNNDYGFISLDGATTDQAKFRVGREAARRFGISSLIDDIKDNELSSETVYASERYGNRYITSVRWSINGSQSEGFSGQEVVVGITVNDVVVDGLREGSAADKTITVSIVGASKEVLQVPLPFTDKPDISFLTALVNSRRKVLEAMIKATSRPHKSTRLTIGSVASSTRVLDSTSNMRSSGSSRSTNMENIAARVRGLRDDSWDLHSGYGDDEDMLSPGEAHGDITVMDDGYATDDDGHSVYYE
ncbi:MAG TPA: hypothetical protein VHE53_01245 [Patescibacteria group bacterium]|nr:hypothetical protein [Patescibacteria group bacterium]